MRFNLRKAVRLPFYAAALIFALAVVPARAQDAFVRFTAPSGGAITNVGGSLDAQFHGSNGWRPLLSLSRGTLNTNGAGSASGGGGTGRASAMMLVLESPVDSLSPRLFLASARGEHFDAVEVVVRRSQVATGAPRPFFTFKVKRAFINRISWQGDAGFETATERTDLVYGLDQITFNQIDLTGAFVSNSVARWDFILNTGGAGTFSNPPPVLAYPAGKRVGLGGGLTIQPGNGPAAFDPLLPLTVIGRGGFTGDVQVDPITGTLMLGRAAPVGGPFDIVVRATDIFGVATNAIASVTVATPPQFIRIEKLGTNVILQLNGNAGRSYQIQSANAVTGAWLDISSPVLIGAGGLTFFTNTHGTNSRFYRAIESP